MIYTIAAWVGVFAMALAIIYVTERWFPWSEKQ